MAYPDRSRILPRAALTTAAGWSPPAPTPDRVTRRDIMRAVHAPAAFARPSHRRAAVDPVRMAMLAIYRIVGAAGTIAVFRRMLNTLGDPMPATIMTLVVLLIVVVTFGKGTDRP